MGKAARKVLMENVRALRERHPELGGLRPWAKRVGVGEATLVRILHATAEVRLDSIEAVAKGFGVPTWMLLVEDLDPDNLPVALSPAERDFYRRLQAAAKSSA